MALEREQKNVAIGNMPYVAPSSSAGIANFAQGVQDDVVKQRKKLQEDEDRISVANRTASIFNQVTQIELDQLTPDSNAFAKDAGTVIRKILAGSENDNVKNELLASTPGIVSGFTNRIAKEQIRYISEAGVEETKVAGKLESQIFANKSTEDLLSKNAFVASDKKIDFLATQQLESARGTLTKSQVNEWARVQKREFRITAAVARYINDATFSPMIADQNLDKAAELWGRTAQEELNFLSIVKSQISSTSAGSKLKQIYNQKIRAYTALGVEAQAEALPKLVYELPPELSDLLLKKAQSDTAFLNALDKTNQLELVLATAVNEADVDIIASNAESHFKTKAEKVSFKKSVQNKKMELFKDDVKNQEDKLKDKRLMNNAIDTNNALDYISQNGAIGPHNARSHLDGTPRSTSDYNRIATALRIESVGRKGAIERQVEKIRTPLDKGSDTAKYLDKDFQRNYTPLLEDAFNPNATPDQFRAKFKQIAEVLNKNNYVPKIIRDVFDFKKLLGADPIAVERTSQLLNFMTQEKGNDINTSVGSMLAEVPVNTRLLLEQIEGLEGEQLISGIKAFQKEILDASNKISQTESVKRANEAMTITGDDPTSDLGNALVELVDSSQLGRWWDNGWNQLFGQKLSNNPMWSAYLRTNKDTYLTESFRSWAQSGFTGLITGWSKGDIKLAYNDSTRKIISRTIGQVFRESKSNITNLQAAKIALTQLGDVMGASTFMMPLVSEDGQEIDSDSEGIYYLPPEKTYGNKGWGPDQLTAGIIETARLAVNGHIFKNPNYERDALGFSDQSSARSQDNGNRLDLGRLLYTGNLRLDNPREDANGTAYEIKVRGEDGTWRKISIPTESGSTGFHFIFNKETLKKPSWMSDITRFTPSMLGGN